MKSKIWQFLESIEQKGGVSEIMINSPSLVFVERAGNKISLDVKFPESSLEEFAQEASQLNRFEFNEYNPIFDGVLPDGSRINIIHSLYGGSYPIITIRKHLHLAQNLSEAQGLFSFNEKWSLFFKACIHAKMNFLISGGTGVGKTSLLNIFLSEVSPDERVICIEDTPEIKTKQQNFIRLEAKPLKKDGLKVRDLLKNSLRMNPDRLIIGEVRGEEAFDLLQALNTGHEGSMSTVHANSPREALSRLENLFTLGGFQMPVYGIRQQINKSFDFIIQLGRSREGQRVIRQVCEMGSMEGDSITLADLGRFNGTELAFSGIVPSRLRQLSSYGVIPDIFRRLG